MPILGGRVKPRRTSRSRRPSMAASTVMHSTSKPASLARRIMSLSRPLSRHTYTWNHLEPSLTAATSSTERVPMVDSEYGRPARSAARATANSPGGWAMRVKPVGARISGKGTSRPRMVPVVSTFPMSRSTRGTNSISRKARVFRSMATSSSAPPSM